MDGSKMSFRRWLWNRLRYWTGLSAKFRSDKEKKLGAFLFITQVFWYLLPNGIIRNLLIFSQIGIGFTLMIHGQYLAYQEEAEMPEKRGEAIAKLVRYIADIDGVDIAESDLIVWEMEEWMLEATDDERIDELLTSEVKASLVRVIADCEGIDIEEATRSVEAMNRLLESKEAEI